MPWSPLPHHLWESYNSEDSVLPFLCPVVLWVSSYLYCHYPYDTTAKANLGTANTATTSEAKETTAAFLMLPTSRQWSDWHALHNIHNLGAVLLGMASLYFHHDAVLNERIVILWNLSYFCVDLVDTATRMDWPFVLHAVCCLGLGLLNYTTPLCRLLRMNSRAAQLELSSPFLHLSKQTREPWHFILFAVVFTLCRILWIPVMMKQLRDHGMEWTDVRLIMVAAFYGLNWYWYAQIIRLFVDGLRGGGIKSKSNRKSKLQ
jgi:hypothetical protein